eukprot:6649581-Pyramimonas_sp.AAC.1
MGLGCSRHWPLQLEWGGGVPRHPGDALVFVLAHLGHASAALRAAVLPKVPRWGWRAPLGGPGCLLRASASYVGAIR